MGNDKNLIQKGLHIVRTGIYEWHRLQNGYFTEHKLIFYRIMLQIFLWNTLKSRLSFT